MAEQKIPLANGDTIVVNTDRRSVVLNLDDLYQYNLIDQGTEVGKGTSGAHIVPNVNDLIYSVSLGQFIVQRVDMTTYVAYLSVYEQPKSPGEVGNEDILLGVGPGYQSETWRCFYDDRVFPYSLQLDGRTRMYSAGDMLIFKGVDISEGGEIIGQYYDQNGQFVSEKIPLALTQSEDPNNKLFYAPVTAYTTTPLKNGQVVTAVFYNKAGVQMSIAKLLIKESSLTRRVGSSAKYVKSIELDSPYLSKTDPTVLELPLNYTADTLALQGKVSYSDGSSKLLPVTTDPGAKFALFGLESWTPSTQGQVEELTLRYLMSDDEYSHDKNVTQNGAITDRYTVKAIPASVSYSVKLFVFPEWINATTGYKLRYWLFDLDRQAYYRLADGLVTLANDSASFDPLDFTTVQTLKVTVDLSKVSKTYIAHRHVQSVSVALKAAGSDRTSNWKVRPVATSKLWFGDKLEAPLTYVNANSSTVNLANGFKTQAEWLEALFYNNLPIFNPRSEARAPVPTHMVLHTASRQYEIDLSLWANDLTITKDLTDGQVLYIRWIKRMANTDLQLGVSGLPLHQVTK